MDLVQFVAAYKRWESSFGEEFYYRNALWNEYVLIRDEYFGFKTYRILTEYFAES